jgi:hypothetical protein
VNYVDYHVDGDAAAGGLGADEAQPSSDKISGMNG